MAFVSNVSGARHVVFFWLDGAMSPEKCRMGYYSSEYEDFMRKIAPAGPVSPSALVAAGKAIAYLDPPQACASSPPNGGYLGFLNAHRFTDEVNLILRCNGDCVAGVAAFRHVDEAGDCYSAASFGRVVPMLEKSIPYIEFNLSRLMGASKAAIRGEITARYGLTLREAEVAELIGAGCTNADIGDVLGLRLATVKTHIINLFRKVGVENRSSLVALLPR